ncbi:hypothetical protein HMPREF2141_00982 [Bacteroides uniformis]|nr:hypothetical protein HMPREF2141_00982 [Bacteroides uniformis]
MWHIFLHKRNVILHNRRAAVARNRNLFPKNAIPYKKERLYLSKGICG